MEETLPTINGLKQRIVKMLEKQKVRIGLRDVVEGAPYFNEIEKVTRTPIAFVTTDQEAAQIDFAGARVDGSTPFDNTYRYGIIVVVSGKDGRATEGKIDDITQRIVDCIKAHPHLPVLDIIPITTGSIGEPSTVTSYVGISGGISSDSDNLYIAGGNIIGVIGRQPPHTLVRNYQTGITDFYSGIAVDNNRIFAFRERTNIVDVFDKNNNRNPPIQYRINTPSTLNHVGMAVVGSELFISDGETSTVHVYAIPNSGTSLVRSRTIAAPLRSFGFFADENFLYYIDVNGNVIVHDTSNREITRSTSPMIDGAVGLTVSNSMIYSITGIGGSEDPKRIVAAPFTFQLDGSTIEERDGTNIADYSLPEMVGAREIGDKKLARYIRVRVAVTEVSGSSTSS